LTAAFSPHHLDSLAAVAADLALDSPLATVAAEFAAHTLDVIAVRA
jgi:hypothetical protein